MDIREYEADDAEAVAEVHRRSVRELCAEDYSEEEIAAWTSDTSKAFELEEDKFRFVAAQDGEIIGFADYSENELTGLYVDPGCAGSGVGKALLRRVEKHAVENGISWLEAESTITAHGFYVDNGFETVEKTTHDIKGYDVTVYLVRKSLF